MGVLQSWFWDCWLQYLASEPQGTMSDIIATMGCLKEGGSSSTIQCPMLNATNYTVCSIRMKISLRVHKVWEVIEEDTTDREKNDMATTLLFQSIPEALILQVGELDTTKKVWETIKARHMGAERVKEARLQTLMAEFDRLKMKKLKILMTSTRNYLKYHQSQQL